MRYRVAEFQGFPEPEILKRIMLEHSKIILPKEGITWIVLVDSQLEEIFLTGGAVKVKQIYISETVAKLHGLPTANKAVLVRSYFQLMGARWYQILKRSRFTVKAVLQTVFEVH